MTTERKLTKAQLIEINWENNGVATVVNGGQNSQGGSGQTSGQSAESNHLQVQFNPASLKVTYSNQVENGGDNSAALQFVGRGDSKLAIELIFDVSGEDASDRQDVRQITRRVAYFMTPNPTDEAPSGGSDSGSGGAEEEQPRYKVPGVRFQWGTFLFDGVMVSMDENLELWSEEGRPLRATVSINLSQPGINFNFRSLNDNQAATDSPGTNRPAGTTPMTPAPAGANLQGLVANAGINADWKAVASANGIENPRDLATGGLVNLRARASPSGGLPGADLQAGASLQANGASVQASIRVS